MTEAGEAPVAASEARDYPRAPRKLPVVTRPRVYLTFPHQNDAPPNILPGSLRIHPRGFRLLKGTSPLERRMNTYFRLPPRPSRQVVEERSRLMRQVAKALPPPGHSAQGTHRVALDGFILLEACGVQDPSEAKECVLCDSNLCGSADEDLPYFNALRFMDLGENWLELADLRKLPALEEVHLHCNGITTLRLTKPSGGAKASSRVKDDNATADDNVNAADDDSSSNSDPQPFSCLHTLNLSFNSIPFKELVQLAHLPSLERIDLSANSLRHLPADLSSLANVSQLALENNKLSDPSVFLALSTMPSLAEVNLNFNHLSSVPRLSVDDGQGVCFPVLRVIGLASNNIEFFEDVYSLTQVGTLRRLVLWGNAIERKMKDCEILVYEFGALDVQVVLESPIPPKRKVGEFYAANVQNFVRVTEKELKPLPKRGEVGRKPQTAPPAGGRHEGDAPGAPSFFVTQVGLEHPTGQADDAPRSHADDERRARRGQSHEAPDDSWFAAGQEGTAAADPLLSQGRIPAGRGVGRVESRETRRHEAEPVGFDDGEEATTGLHGIANAGFQPEFDDSRGGGDREAYCRPNANVRAVMAELKRMLRQPLPPIQPAQFEQTTASNRNHRRKGGD